MKISVYLYNTLAWNPKPFEDGDQMPMIWFLDFSGVWMPTYNNHPLSFCNIAAWLIFPLLQFTLFRFSFFRSPLSYYYPSKDWFGKTFVRLAPAFCAGKITGEGGWIWTFGIMRPMHLQTNLAKLLFSELQASEIHERSLSTFAMPSDDPVVVWNVASVETDVHLRRLLPKQSSRSFCHRYRRQRIRWVKKWDKNNMKESTIE